MTGKMKLLLGALSVSILLNVFALGLMVGEGARNIVPGRDRMSPPADFNFKRLERNLQIEQRKKVRTLLREKNKELRSGYRALRETEQQIRKIILSETVDRNALREALERHGEQARKLHEPMRGIMMETIAGFDFETRQKIVEDMFRGPRKQKMRLSSHHRPPHEGRMPPSEEQR